MSIEDCISKIQIGDEVLISRKNPWFDDFAGQFHSTVIAFNRESPFIGSNYPQGLNGGRPDWLSTTSKMFEFYATLTSDRFNVHRIIKNVKTPIMS